MFKKIILTCLLMSAWGLAQASVSSPPSEMSQDTKNCVSCHQKNNPGIVQQWGKSKHYGANVGCYECHAADEEDIDAFEHGKKKNKKHISILVTPKDCSNCHEKAVKEVTGSRHAKAGHILDSLDNLLAEVVEGNRGFVTEGFPEGNSAAAVNGCWQCHGGKVKVLDNGRLDPATWPNTGIGRINPDGSEGACSACHSRHQFSIAQARRPDNCAKCHMGPDHPQKELYEESKHGIAYQAHMDELNLDSPKWVVGEDYTAAPTCVTCHMGATRNQEASHNVGLRLSWNNRPPISQRPEVMDAKMGLESASIGWEDRRDNMKDVCTACHTENFIENFYVQYDGAIDLYNEKYAKPGIMLMKLAAPLKNPVKFSTKLDFVWFELWHHEGRRARMAVSMQAPDIAHWEGTYDLAKNFYTEFIPELKELVEHGMKHGKKREAKALEKALHEVLTSRNHKWFLGK